MSSKRGSYTRRNTRKFSRDELRAHEVTRAKALGIKIAAQTKRFFAKRDLEGAGQSLSPDWDTVSLEATTKRFVRYKPTDFPPPSGEPNSLKVGTTAFALRVAEEMRIAKASGKISCPAQDGTMGGNTDHSGESCATYPH